VCKFFFSFRRTTYREFAQLFEQEEKVDGFVDDNKPSGQDLQSKYGWYSILYSLANENILNIKKITLIPIYETLTFLCYQMDYQQEMRKKQNNSIV